MGAATALLGLPYRLTLKFFMRETSRELSTPITKGESTAFKKRCKTVIYARGTKSYCNRRVSADKSGVGGWECRQWDK